MPFLQTKSIKIFYDEIGSKEPLLLIAGMSECSKWENCIKLLKDDFRLITFDNRGTGQTDKPLAPYSIEMLAQDTICLMDALSLSKVSIVGHSMGGAIALQLCLDYPDRVNKAMILSSAAKFHFASMMSFEIFSELLKAGVEFRLALKSTFPFMFSNSFLSDPSKVEAFLDKMCEHPISSNGYAGQFFAISNFDVQKRLKEICIETLIAVGEEDLCTPLYCSNFLKDHIKNSSLHVLKSAAHMLPIENARGLVTLVKSFF